MPILKNAPSKRVGMIKHWKKFYYSLIIFISFTKLNCLILLTSSSDVSLKVFDLHSRWKTKSKDLLGRKEFYLKLILQANIFYTLRKVNFINGLCIFWILQKAQHSGAGFFYVKVV